jgi:hypothetical protein
MRYGPRMGAARETGEVDDRGVALPHVPLRVVKASPAMRDRSIKRAVTRARGREPLTRTQIVSTVLVSFFPLLISPFVYFVVSNGVSEWAARLAFFLLVAGWFWYRSEFSRDNHPPPWALAAAGACGACGTMLDTIPVQSDGCRVCPECGAAWKPERSAQCAEFVSQNVKCARCGTRLPGPGRVCPRCGVMAGETPA